MDLKPKDQEVYSIVKEIYEELPDSVKGFYSDVIVSKMFDLLLEVDSCESPIEQMMYIALTEQMNIRFKRRGFEFDHYINLQETIEANGNRYRVDFFVVIIIKGEHYGFIVECDGHDFHEKTKEQVRKDKKRDRDLMLRGYPVIRFSGSEIYNNPIDCAREVTSLIISHIDKG